MSWDRAAADAFDRLRGYSQEYLDDVHKGADERRAMLDARGPQPPFEWVDSDSDFDDADRAPLSPPPSPKGDGPDLSIAAWDRRKWSDLARGIETRDSGFDNFETWRCHVISKHAQKVLPTSTPPQKSGVRKKRRSAVTVSERITRSKATTASLFYELSHNGKIRQPLPITSSISPSRSRLLPHATRSSR